MSLIKWLNNLLFLEKLLGIYRNYVNQNKIKKCLIIFQIIVQTLVHTSALLGQAYFVFGKHGYGSNVNLNYGGLATSVYVTAAPSVVMGICYSAAFTSYLKSVNRVLETFKNDKKLIKSLKKTYHLSVIFILISILFGILRSVEVSIKFSLSELIIAFPILISQCILRITILFQYLMFFVIIMIVVHLSKSLTSLVSAVQEGVEICDVSSEGQFHITREQVEEWVELYEDLANCCEKVSLCFGRQFFFSLITALAYYVMLIYQICYVNPFYAGYSDEFKSVVVIIFCYLSVMAMPFAAGQMANNQGAKIRIELARLYNAMIIDSSEADAKLIKDFIRLIKKNPLEIKLLSNLTAGMYMLPVILTFAVNYLIVMLQFTHII